MLSILAALAVALVACSSDEDADGRESATSAATETTAAPTTPNEATVANDLEGRGYASTDHLVTTAWLEQHLQDAGLLVLDLRSEEDYASGHIAGAVRLTPGEAFQTVVDGVEGQLPPKDAVEAALGAVGATPDSTIVLYDGARSLWSTRGVWALTVYGHANVKILDGAWDLWSQQGRPVATAATVAVATDYTFPGPGNNNIVASWDEVVASVDDPAVLTCDVRSAEEYWGRDVRADRGGHVPDAVNIEWSRAVGETGEFLAADQLRPLYEGEGINANGTVYTMCQTGVRAAHTWFVLYGLLGYPDVRVYDGSWTEYGNRADSPIES